MNGSRCHVKYSRCTSGAVPGAAGASTRSAIALPTTLRQKLVYDDPLVVPAHDSLHLFKVVDTVGDRIVKPDEEQM